MKMKHFSIQISKFILITHSVVKLAQLHTVILYFQLRMVILITIKISYLTQNKNLNTEATVTGLHCFLLEINIYYVMLLLPMLAFESLFFNQNRFTIQLTNFIFQLF